MADNQDVLSAEDLLALHQTYLHLSEAGDPRADKLRQYLVASGKEALANPQANQTQFEKANTQKTSAGDTVKGVLSGAWNGVKGAAQLVGAVAQSAIGNPEPMGQVVGNTADAMQRGYEATPQGASLPEKVAMTAGPAVGVNTPALAQAARNRDLGGAVIASAPAVIAATVPAAADAAVGRFGSAVQAKLAAYAPDLYRSALKPTTVPKMQAQVQAGIQTGLDYGIPVSEAGLEKLSNLIEDTNDKISAAIQADPTRPISAEKVAARTDAVKSRFENQVNPNDDLATIQGVKQEFRANQGAKPGTPATGPKATGLLDAQGNPIMSSGTPATPATPAQPLNAADAQAMKQGTYQQLKGKAYGELKTASVEAQKGLARGLKEELAQAFPELTALNAQDSQFYGFEPILQRAVARIDNHQLMGIGTPAAVGAAKAATGSSAAAAVAGTIKAVVDNPAVKSRLAIMINKASKGTVTLPQAMARIGAYSSALAQASTSGNEQPDANQIASPAN